jgi:hypothetical protein
VHVFGPNIHLSFCLNGPCVAKRIIKRAGEAMGCAAHQATPHGEKRKEISPSSPLLLKIRCIYKLGIVDVHE